MQAYSAAFAFGIRVANHKTSSVTDVYDRHGCAEEDRRIMAAVARHVATLVDEAGTGSVVSLTPARAPAPA
jgi:hypothetical protein